LHQRIPDQHSDDDDRETGPPAEPIGEDWAQDLRADRADVDAHVEYGEAGISPPIPLLVERAHNRRDIRLEEAIADHDQTQREQH
jgi:hypothetical protein